MDPKVEVVSDHIFQMLRRHNHGHTAVEIDDVGRAVALAQARYGGKGEMTIKMKFETPKGADKHMTVISVEVTGKPSKPPVGKTFMFIDEEENGTLVRNDPRQGDIPGLVAVERSA